MGVALLVQDVVEVRWTITGDLVAPIRNNRRVLLLFRFVESNTEVNK